MSTPSQSILELLKQIACTSTKPKTLDQAKHSLEEIAKRAGVCRASLAVPAVTTQADRPGATAATQKPVASATNGHDFSALTGHARTNAVIRWASEVRPEIGKLTGLAKILASLKLAKDAEQPEGA